MRNFPTPAELAGPSRGARLPLHPVPGRSRTAADRVAREERDVLSADDDHAVYWATRNLWMNPRSGAVAATCNACGAEAVLCTLDGIAVRAYHPAGVKYDPANPCPVLIPIGGVPGAPLSHDILPNNVTPDEQP